LLPFLVAFQLFAIYAYSKGADFVLARHWLRPLPEPQALSVYTLLSILSIAIGYSFFVIFIQTEGRQTIQAQTELALAHSIQETLVPRLDLTLANCRIFGISIPSDKVGGDIVDVVLLPDGSVAAYVADVAGHGLQAGILMGMVKTHSVGWPNTSPMSSYRLDYSHSPTIAASRFHAPREICL
jgi:hypothetical protein